MKNLKYFFMLLLGVVMSVSIVSCGGSDDETPNTETSLAGSWNMESEVWYEYTNGAPNLNVITDSEVYSNTSNTCVWIFVADGDNYQIQVLKNGQVVTNNRTFTKIGTNEYKRNNDRIIIKTLTANKLVFEYYDNYYRGENIEYGIYTFTK